MAYNQYSQWSYSGQMKDNWLDTAKNNFQKFYSAEIRETDRVHYSYQPPQTSWLATIPQVEKEVVYQISIRQSQLEKLMELFVNEDQIVSLLVLLRSNNHSIVELLELIRQADYRKEDEVLNTMYEQYLTMCALKGKIVDKV